MLRLPNRKIHLITFWIAISALYSFTIVSAELSMMPFASMRGFMLLAAKWVTISLCASGVIGLICLWRVAFAVLWPILFVISSVAAYFIVSIGTSITPGVLELADANGLSMWATLISAKLLVIAALALMLSVVAVYFRWNNVMTCGIRIRLVMLAGFLTLTILPVSIPSSVCIAVKARLPYSIYFSIRDFLSTRQSIEDIRTTYDNTNVSRSATSPDVYFVIGESLRADHLPQNGYSRNTMPLISCDSDMVSYSAIYSDAYYTHASVPVIMTDSDSLTRDSIYTRQSFIPLFKKAGYRSAWFANQDLSNSYAPFANEADTLIFCNNVMSIYTYKKYIDTEILPRLESWRAANDNKPMLAVIHTIGSHWWYRSHYPESNNNFKPEIDSHDVSSLSHEQMINSYDNTILETDRFLAGLCDMLRETNSVIIYISDHGENLGEDGMYLHTVGLDATHRPACMIWYSDLYRRLHPEKTDAIHRNQSVKGNTDMMFHTVIDLAGLETNAFDRNRSLLAD